MRERGILLLNPETVRRLTGGDTEPTLPESWKPGECREFTLYCPRTHPAV